MFTRRALGFLLLSLAVYFFAVQTQIGWLYVIEAMLLSLLVVSALYPWLSLRNIEARREILDQEGTPATEIFEDDSLLVRLTLTNSGRFSKYLLRLEEYCPLDSPQERIKFFFIPHLKGGSSLELSYPVFCYKRGPYVFPPPMLETRAPFGLFRRRIPLHLTSELLVYPRYYELGELPFLREEPARQPQQVRAGHGIEIYGIREYRPGDPLRRIHWRSAARLGELVVKEFEQSARSAVGVVLDLSMELGEGRETTLEYSVKIAASVAHSALRGGHPLRLIAADSPQRELSWWQALDYLARVETTGRTPLAEVLAQRGLPPSLIVILPSARDVPLEALRRLVAGRGRILVILLTGFGAEDPSILAEDLREMGVQVALCAKGSDLARSLGDALTPAPARRGLP